MKFSQVFRGLWLVLIALLLAGCIPHADFKVTPQPVSAGQLATFDASASSPFNASAGNRLVDYAWDFGDGSKASGKVATHTYARSGEYRVRLTVKDSRGFSDTRQLKLKVGDAVGTGTSKVLVRSAQGVLLANAEVGIGGVTANSDAEGVANLSGVPTGDRVVVVKKPGFVTQAQQLKIEAGTLAEIQVLLQPVKENKQIADIAAAQAILGKTLGAQIILPANAFVDAAGNPATGAVTLNWTPWDITSDDLQAMPGNGRAIGADGQMTDLISAGMMTVDFLDAQGNHLQLAAGKKATIRMDLPFTRINGVDLTEGSEIPMWTFDESQGLWIEEGMGYVVSSSSSSTGLAVEAEVGHFSTWNWDFKFNNPNTLNVSCVDSAGLGVACNVVATVELDTGGRLTNSNYLPVGGLTIINMPSAGTVHWEATTSDGLMGTTSSGLSGSVVIQIAAPLTSNFVQCQKGGEYVGCKVVVSAVVDGNAESRVVSIPAEGGWVRTTWNATTLDWYGESGLTLNGDQWERHSGSASSATTGNVTLMLVDVTTIPVDRQFQARCVAVEWPGVEPTTCDLRVELNNWGYEFVSAFSSYGPSIINFNNVPIGQVVSFNVPTDQFNYLQIQGDYPGIPDYSGWAWVEDLNGYIGGVIEVLIGGRPEVMPS